MSAERDKMVASLKEHVVPVLKARGFSGSFPNFRRITETKIHLLTFQFDKWGGGFAVEIAHCSPQGITTHWGKQIPPNKVTAHDINPRLRLGASDEQSDHWFRYDQQESLSFQDPYEKTAGEVLPYLDTQAESYWSNSNAEPPSGRTYVE